MKDRRIIFDAILKKVPGIDGAYLCIPADVLEILGNKKRIKVNATFDGVPYRGSIVNMGRGMMLGVTKEIRNKTGKEAGDPVLVTLEEDLEEQTVELPAGFESALKDLPEAFAFFSSLSFTNRKEYVSWITQAKKEETKRERLQKAVEKLLLRKKNPSEK